MSIKASTMETVAGKQDSSMNKRLPDEVYEALAPGSTAKPTFPKEMFSSAQTAHRSPVAIAYGLLWLFQGNSAERAHDELVFSARRHLRDWLSRDECKAGIEFAKEIAAAKGVSIEPPSEWMAEYNGGDTPPV
jgi:hypothetical protein